MLSVSKVNGTTYIDERTTKTTPPIISIRSDYVYIDLTKEECKWLVDVLSKLIGEDVVIS